MSFANLESLPEIVNVKIIDHLDSSDVLNSFLVCKNWHNYLSGLPECMKKIRLRVEGWQELKHVSRLLMKSPRSYSSIHLNNVNPEHKFKYITYPIWKEIQLEQMKFQSAGHFLSYLTQFGESIEKLEIERIYFVDNLDFPIGSLHLPKLKHLRLKQVPTLMFRIFQRYEKLKTLHFDIPAFGTKTRSDITNFFENFRGITLEELFICRNSLYALSFEDIGTMESIIISMTPTLKILHLKNWGFSFTLDRIWNDLKVLDFSIHCGSHEPKINDVISMSPNLHLTTLEIFLLRLPSMIWFKKFFQLIPNLKRLRIPHVRKEIIYLAAHNLRNLTLFAYESCFIEIEDPDEDEVMTFESDLGNEYNFIGPDEIFDLETTNTQLTQHVKRYNDLSLDISFGEIFYHELKTREPLVNQKIYIIKESFASN